MTNDPASAIFDYLSTEDSLGTGPYDAIVGFGMFDVSLARFCGDLFQARLAPRIVFTGGIGAGTGNLGGPEAEVWREELRRSHPAIPDAAVILESRSTNTGENVAFTTALLERDYPDLAFGRGLRRIIVVASPTRLRRVWLTLRRQHPDLALTRRLPSGTSLETDRALYQAQGIDYVAHLVGELDRIEQYPARGFILPEALPVEVQLARQALDRHRRAIVAPSTRRQATGEETN
jgi:uncharacterized SAM-binding protein YcdF (DUF218 family)